MFKTSTFQAAKTRDPPAYGMKDEEATKRRRKTP